MKEAEPPRKMGSASFLRIRESPDPLAVRGQVLKDSGTAVFLDDELPYPVVLLLLYYVTYCKSTN